MKKWLMTLLTALVCCTAAFCRTRNDNVPKLTFGAEWSYAAMLYSGEYHYFISPDGFRDEIEYSGFGYDTDSEIALHVGYNFNSNWNLSLYAGYAGIGRFHRAIPISIRATRYFGDNPLKDRWFAFLDLGSGVSIKSKPEEIATGKIGGGYRLSLSRYSKLDFLLALRAVYTHPDIVYYGNSIVPDKTYRNDGVIAGLSFGIGITF